MRFVATMMGSEFERMTAYHPFMDRDCSGHSGRPRHAGRRLRLRPHRALPSVWTTSMSASAIPRSLPTSPWRSPVNAQGKLNEFAGKYEGLHVFKAHDTIYQ